MGSYTDIERPSDVASLVLTPTEAEAYEDRRRALHGMLPSKPGEVGQAENEFIDRGDHLARVRGQIRSSWIVDPADGQIPFRPEVLAKLDKHRGVLERPFDNPEQLTGPERCVAAVSGGAPLLGAPDANLIQIIEAPDVIAIVGEKYHDARIVRFGSSAPTDTPQTWLSNSVGRWEGKTLCVETSGFRPGVTHRGQRVYVSGETRVAERFTRSSAVELLYEFAVTDPSLFSRPWRGEMTFQAARGRMFEYACHEGNYALEAILAGERQRDHH